MHSKAIRRRSTGLPRRIADFATLGEALDYAAKGNRGMNFHDARGTLVRAYPYSELRQDALGHARRFIALGLKKGDRLALIAETGPEFAACFFGAIYAGLWPVPLPLPTSFGGRDAYVDQLVVMLTSSDPQLFLYPAGAGRIRDRRGRTSAASRRATGKAWRRSSRPVLWRCPRPARTRSPICNIRAARPASRMASRSPTARCSTTSTPMASATEVQETDRCISWLPWYHDMGLVGCMLSPLAHAGLASTI